MYENNHPNAPRRSGDDFLRRMICGDLPGMSIPAMSRPVPAPAVPPAPVPDQASCLNGGTGISGMPSLAMVYAPAQEWRCLFAPCDALRNGTMFRELFLPFEGHSVHGRAH